MDDQGRGMDSENGWVSTGYSAWDSENTHKNMCDEEELIGELMMGPDRILAWQALPPPPLPLLRAGVPTRIFQDPQALPALPLGPMPLKRQPQQAL